MSLAIRKLTGATPVEASAVDAFLGDRTFPLVEDCHATFVYRGEPDEVRLRHWIFGLSSSQPFHRIEGTDLWYHVLELPEGSRVEYKLEVRTGDHWQLVMDPRNPNVAHDPFGANSVCHAAGYGTPEWSEHDPEAREGTLETHRIPSRAFRGERETTLYFPARYRKTSRYPLLVVHDGVDYLRFADLKTVLDNLIHRLEIPPMIVALTRPVRRNREYANHKGHACFLTKELVPWVEERYPVDPRPAARCLMGASFGAVASLATAWRYPGFWGRLLLQSGSFAFTDIGENKRGPGFQPVVDFVNAFRDDPGKPSEKIFMSCGMYESLIYENRSMMPLLQGTGMDIRYVEARDGHNWENWRDRLREGLSWLFPGPLWMVYE